MRTVLFDLDGTLTDSRAGIFNSLVHAFTAMGLPVPPEETLLGFVGPPLHGAFREIAGLDEPAAHQAVAAYREYYVDRGIYENALYPGVPALLDGLVARGTTLAVASSKPVVFVERILAYFGIRGAFRAVCGGDLAGHRQGKPEVIGDALQALGVGDGAGPVRRPAGEGPVRRPAGEGLAGAVTVMVGDRHHDVAGAARHGLPCIGVTWGFGSPDELRSAGAVALATSMEELAALLG